MHKLFIFLVLMIFFTGCKEEPQIKVDLYTGPVIEGYDILTIYSDSARTKIQLKAPHQLEFENGDQEFPEGINMEFYDDKTFEKSSTLTGNHARYIKEKDVYVVTGNVIVESIGEKKTLKTEELVWNPGKKEITSDKFVHIQTPTEILKGTGLVSNEDFSVYKILKPTATIFLDENE